MEIAICDDDKGCCEQIENWIKDFSKRESVQINTHIFNNGEALIKSVKERGFFDMLFLDIELPNTNGVQLGTVIRSIETCLLYTSTIVKSK